MGIEARAHIRHLCSDSQIRSVWIKGKRAPPSDADIDRMYDASVAGDKT